MIILTKLVRTAYKVIDVSYFDEENNLCTEKLELLHDSHDGSYWVNAFDRELSLELNEEGIVTQVEVSHRFKNACDLEIDLDYENRLNEPAKHVTFDDIITCVDLGIPVYLYGPSGSGKNHVLQQVANELGLEFYFTNSVQQEYKLTGFIDAGGKYHETEFYKAFTKGGLFFLDELDASIPEVLVLLNAAIANRYFEFPNGKVFAHKEFKVVAAGNTVGTGADEQYSGRLQLDQSTLDRFAMINFDYDINIEMKLAKGDTQLVKFIHNLRSQSKAKGIQTTFSYRCISMVKQLENIMPLSKVLKIAVLKGMDFDTVKTFIFEPDNKYSDAVIELMDNWN